MKMHFLSGGRLRMRRSVYYPDAAREEAIEIPVSCTLMKHPQGNVLFDTGCSPRAAIDPVSRWGGLAKVMAPIFEAKDAVVHQLARADLTADDIDVVICSHLHADHCGCNEHFSRATVICHAAELAAARAENAQQMGYLPHEWTVPQGLDTFDGQRDLFGDGRIVIVPMVGHTPGMSVVLAALEKSGAFLLASDAVPLEVNLREGYVPKNSWDIEKSMAGIDEARRLQERGVTIIYGHDEAQWRALRTGAAFYE